jgi:hypothetical protein
VLANSQAEAAQQQAQQQAQDPIVQMQQAELQIKQVSWALKRRNYKWIAATKADELGLREKELQVKAGELLMK